MDYAQLSQLPLTVLVILGAYWVIQRINDDHAKQIIALTTGFLAKKEPVYAAVQRRLLGVRALALDWLRE